MTGLLEIAEKAYKNLFIRSPSNGIVTARNVELGQQITAQLQATVLYEIAEDLQNMEAWIDVDEADIGMIKEGQEAFFTVDSFPKQKFNAKVKRIRYQAKIIDNVVTYATVLDVKNPDLKLRPGMTTNVDIRVAEAKQALTVPNKALRINSQILKDNAQQLKLKFEEITGEENVTYTERRTSGKQIKKEKETLWIWQENKIKQIEVDFGINDGKYMQVLKGIDENVSVITEVDEIKRDYKFLQGMIGGAGIGSR
jgi:HlyD family secretion protein